MINSADQLFMLASQTSGSVYSLWMSSGRPEPPVVLLDSEGEIAKVSETATQFLQMALSLAPNWMDCLLGLPGIHGGMSDAPAAEYDMDAMTARIASWRGDPHPPPISFGMSAEDCAATFVQARAQADLVLESVGLERLDVKTALAQLWEAYRSGPRFTPPSTE